MANFPLQDSLIRFVMARVMVCSEEIWLFRRFVCFFMFQTIPQCTDDSSKNDDDFYL